MTTLHEKSKRKHADREREYKQRNREKVSAYNKDYYGKTKGKKYDTGVGQSQIKLLHEEDFQRFSVAKEWVDILKADVSLDILREIKNSLEIDRKNYDYWGKTVIPLRILQNRLQNPSIIRLLEQLELTPPGKKKYEIPLHTHAPCWTFAKEWGETRKDGLNTILEMKKRFIQEIIDSWNQNQFNRGLDQWLDPIDCKGCPYSFKGLMSHLLISPKCRECYTPTEIASLEQQSFDISKEKEKKWKKDNLNQPKKPKWRYWAGYNPSTNATRHPVKVPVNADKSQVDAEVPNNLLPFAKKDIEVDKTMKNPIKILK